MPNNELNANQIYRFVIHYPGNGPVNTQPNRYSLAEFWILYKSTFNPKWDAGGATYGAPRDLTITLVAPWGCIEIYPLPESIGAGKVKALRELADAGQVQCVQCKGYFPQDDLTEVTIDGDTGLCCEACKDSISTCDRCSELTTETHTVRTASGRRDTEEWCEPCKDDHTQKCDDCGDWFSNDCDGMSHRNDWYCESCAENYSTCYECGTLLSQDNQCWDEDSGNIYCEHHMPSDREDEDEDNEYIHDYGYKPRPIFHGNPSQIHYGVELEVTCDPDTAEDTLDLFGGESHVYLKQDSSIQGGGYEIVTHPHTLAAHRKLWEPFNAFARNHAFKANSNGMHVHIERAKLTPFRIAVLQRFINQDANRRFIHAIAQRDPSQWGACKSELAKMSSHGDGKRYSALNLENSKTVEIRIFRGTIRKSEFFKNLEFCDALVNWSVDRSHKETTVSDFTSYVRANRKAYTYLDAFLVESKYLPALKTDTRKAETTCV